MHAGIEMGKLLVDATEGGVAFLAMGVVLVLGLEAELVSGVVYRAVDEFDDVFGSFGVFAGVMGGLFGVGKSCTEFFFFLVKLGLEVVHFSFVFFLETAHFVFAGCVDSCGCGGKEGEDRSGFLELSSEEVGGGFGGGGGEGEFLSEEGGEEGVAVLGSENDGGVGGLIGVEPLFEGGEGLLESSGGLGGEEFLGSLSGEESCEGFDVTEGVFEVGEVGGKGGDGFVVVFDVLELEQAADEFEGGAGQGEGFCSGA